jgi:hypothetical protein
LKRKIKTVYFGSFISFSKIDPPMYCSSQECLEFVNEWLASTGVRFEFKNQIDAGITENEGIFREMVEKYPEILALTSSCYTQLNFREHRYELFKSKVPSIPIYEGCGSCIKCLRINMAILLYGKQGTEKDRQVLKSHIMRLFTHKYASDSVLKNLYTEMSRS